MEEKKLRFWEEFIGCFNPNFYKNITVQKFSKSLGFLTIFLVIACLLVTVKVSIMSNRFVLTAAGWIKENSAERISQIIPEEIRIENGIVTTAVAQPYIRKLTDEFTYIIDTTGKTISLDAFKNAVLIGRSKIITKNTENGRVRIEETDLSKVKKLIVAKGDDSKGELIKVQADNTAINVTHKLLERLARRFLLIFIPIVFIFIFGYYWSVKLLQILIFSVISLLANAVLSAGLGYRALVNIGAYAIVPPTIIGFVLLISNFNIAFFGLVYVIIYSGFLALAVSRSKQGSGNA